MTENKRIIIGILARDCEATLPNNIKKIEELRKVFGSSEVCIVENDSIDKTKELFHEWQTNSSNIHLDSFNDKTKASESLASKGVDRNTKMVGYRNRLISKVQSLPPSDYVLFLDIDIFDFDVEGIIKALKNAPDNWGGLFADGSLSVLLGKKLSDKKIGVQYDTYAYAKDMDDDYLNPKRYGKIQQILLGRKMQKSINKDDFAPCLSAFGGIGLYKHSAILNLSYENIKINDSLFICEHIPFNYIITKAGYKNYISKDIKVHYGVIDVKGFKSYLLYYFPAAFNICHYLLKRK